MKQTNNAIKFLMAQYRAIFQNAYFKGLATAAVVTMGLAAGQAQAAITDKTGWEELTTKTDSITITDNVTATNTKEFNLTLTGKTNKINGGSGGATSLTAQQGTITLNDENAALTIGAKTEDKGTTLDIKALDIQNGTVTLTNTANSGSNVKLNTLNLGSNGKLVVSGSDTKATIGEADKTTINLGAGIIELISGAVAGKQLTATGGTIHFKDTNSWTTPNYVEGSTGTAQKQNITIDAEKTGTIALAGKGTNRGIMHFASGSVINLASDDTAPSTLKIDSGSTTLGSLVIFDANVDLKTSGEAASGSYLTIQGVADADSQEKYSELQADADVIGKYLTTGSKADIVLKKDAKLVLQGKKVVLGDETANASEALTIKIANGKGTDKATGTVIVSGTNSIVHADTFEIASKAGDGSNLAANLTLSANDMKLGIEAVGASLQAKNVTFVSSAYNKPYTLQDTLTLSSTTETDDGIKATSGTITANPEGIVVSGGKAKPLTIKGGIYEAAKLGVKSGSIAVSNTEADLSKLSIGTLSLDNTNANEITISGAKDKEAVLDLSNTTLELKGNTSNKTSITVGEHGTLLVSGENLAKLINKEDAWGASNKGAGIYISGGEVDTLLTSIDAELTVGDLISGSDVAENKIVFHESNGGTLNTQSLTLADTAGNGVLDIGGSATLDVGNTLSIKDVKSGDLVVQTGNIAVGEAINAATGSKSGTKLVLGKENTGSATLQLGDIYFDKDTNKIEHTADTGAKVDVDLVLDGKSSSDKSNLTVKYGHWTAKDITAENATIAIGSSDFEVKGAKDPQDHKFGLTANSLTLDAAATVTVDQNLEGSTQAQELVVGKLSTTEANAITLKGDMTLKGDGSEANKFGLALKAKAISVEQGGSLTITDAALNAIKIDNNTVTIQDNAYAANALVSKTGSVVKLDFTSGTSLSNEALTQLRNKLFDLNGKDHLAGTLNVGDAKIAGLPTVGSDGKVEWSDLAANKDVITDTTNNDLMNATVTGVTSAKPIRGSFGAVTSTQATDINNDERLTLNKADQGYFAAQVDAHGNLVKDSDDNVVALGFTVAQDTDLTLNNGGKAGNITLNKNSGLVIGGKADGVTELTKVSGGNDASLDLLAGTLQVTNKDKKAEVSVGELSTAAGTTLKADKLTVSSTSEVKGNLDVTTKAEFKGKAKLSGQNTLAAVDFEEETSIVAGKTTVSGDLNVAAGKKLSVIGGATLDVKTLKALGTGTGTEIFVGQSKDEPNGIDSTSGVLAADLFNLNGASLVIDPEFGEAASFAGADIFGNYAKAEDAGIVHGNIYALQNAIASIGNKDEKEVKAKFAQFLDAKTGSLQKDGVGAIAYVAKNVKINDGSKIVVDPAATDKTYKATANTTEYNNGDLYLGKGAALAVDVSALADSTKAAITFNKTNADAVVYAKDSTKSAIYVTGSLADINKNAIKLFDNKGGTQKVKLDLGNTNGSETGKLTVQTINGLYAGSITEGDITNSTVNLAFQTQKANQTFDVVSAPVKDTLLAAGAGFFDYDEAKPTDKVLGMHSTTS